MFINKNMKKLFSIILISSVFIVNSAIFALPVLAYEKDGVNFEQIRAEAISDNSGATLNKTNSLSQEIKSFSPDSSITKKEYSELGKSLRIEGTEKDYVEGEILIKYKNNKINLNTLSGRTAALNFISSKSLENKEDIRKANISVLKIKDSKTVEQKIAELKNDPNVEYAQPNYQYYPTVINTNDTSRGLLWGLDNTGQSVNGVSGTSDADIDAPEAWTINEGTNASIIVAVIDSGVAYNHPDLAANMWDGTSCKDENGITIVGGCNHGYDYEDGDNTPLPTTSSHGTHIAGTIAAAKNNGKGIIGVAPNVKIMVLKSSLTTADNVKSINFAKQNGAKIINASWGGTNDDQLLKDAIALFPGLFIASAGNCGDINTYLNNECTSLNQTLYPASFDLDNIISVAATDQNDNLATFSNYGATSVDVGAPGTNIYSTVPSITNSSPLSESFSSVANFSIPSGWTQNGFWGVWNTGVPGWDQVLYGDVSPAPYHNNADTIITVPTINLGGATAGYVDFWAVCDTEYITSGWADYMQLEYSADGVNFFVPPDPFYGVLGDGFRWDEPTLDVFSGENPLNSSGSSMFHYNNIPIPSQYLTSNFKLRFRWMTNASDNNYNGCLVDDVKVIKRVVSNGSDEQYDYSDGTSMAAPHVAGLAALIEGYNPNLTSAQVKSSILTTGDSLASLSGKTVSGERINAQKALQAVNPAKTITAFSFTTPTATGVITEADHTIAVTVPFGTNVTTLIPTIVITGASVSPASGVAHDFTSPVTYTVTAADSSAQAYIVTVTIAPISDSDAVATDKVALVDNFIRGANPDLSHITTALTNPLPANGLNGSTITWASDKTGVVSNNGQTIVRPPFELGNDTVTLTATLTKGVASDTKAFTLIVLKLPASTIATITSATYTVSAGGTTAETITNVPFGTTKTAFLAALAKGETHQSWVDTGITDPVVTNNTLVVTAQDGSTTVTYTVTVNAAPDITAPVIDSFVIPETSNSLIVSISSFIAHDNIGVTGYLLTETSDIPSIGNPSWSAIVPSNHTFSTEGVKTLYAWAKDAANNISLSLNDSVTITLPDITAPVITLLGDNPVNLYVGDSYTDDGATALDNIDGDITANIAIVNPVNTSLVGAYIITYNVSDAAGNLADEVTRTVNVSAIPDTTTPVITAPVDQTFEATGSSTTPTLVEATATDNVDPNPVITYIPHSFPVGETTVTWTATDASGNASTITSNVIIQDTTPPVIASHNNVTVEADLLIGTVVNYDLPIATDLVDGSVAIICAPPSGSLFAIATTKVDCTAHDTADNINNVFFNVIVQDTTKPVIVINGSTLINLHVGDSYTDEGATASDNIDGDITSKISVGGDSVNTSAPGVYYITYNVSDNAGNSANQITRTVAVSDVSAPVINPISDITEEATGSSGATAIYEKVTATDDVDGIIPAICAPASGSIFPVGNTPVACSATDSSGNVGYGVGLTIIVTDHTSPTIDSHDNITAEAISHSGATVTYTPPMSHDIVDGDVSAECIPVSDSIFPLGETIITCSKTDTHENAATSTTFTVTVVDTTKPVIARLGTAEVTIGEHNDYIDAGATASDNYDGDITLSIITVNPVNKDVVGDYTVTYNVTDSHSNVAVEVTRIVHVITDATPPVITLNGDATVTLVFGSVFTDPGATATDNIDGNITANILVSGDTVNTSVAGTYIIKYDVSDSAGNSAVQKIRTIIVEPPVPIITAETAASATTNSITVNWATDHPATSRVIYDTISHSTLGSAPNYGYAFSTVEDPLLVTSHSIIVSGLTSETTYFLRTVSHGSPETVSNEINRSTTAASSGGGGGGGGSTYMSPTPTHTPTPIKKGDANNDNKVDKYDFSLMMANWGKTGTNTCDFNGDGKVDKYDFALLMSNWGL